MTRDSEIKGLPGDLNTSRVLEKDHAQTNIGGPVPDFAEGHAPAPFLKPLAENAQEK